MFKPYMKKPINIYWLWLQSVAVDCNTQIEIEDDGFKTDDDGSLNPPSIGLSLYHGRHTNPRPRRSFLSGRAFGAFNEALAL